MEKTQIISQLREFIKANRKKESDKKRKRLLALLENVTSNAISVGNAPNLFWAYMECNSTGVGTSTFKGTETQRTVARDYVTDEYLFIDGHTGAGVKALQLFFLKPNQTIHYYNKNDVTSIAKQYGFRLHLQYFNDLNFNLSDHRLNRHTVHVTRGPITYPVRPIIATVSKKGDKMTIGYVYEKDGVEHVMIEPDDSLNGGDKAKESGCAPWMFLGFLFPPIFLVAIFVWLVNKEKDRLIN